MRTNQLIASVMLAAVVSAVSLHGQAPAPLPATTSPYVDGRNGVGLEEAIARALEREPSLQAERTNIGVARGLRQQAGLRPNPTFSLERRDEPGGTDNQTSAGIEWPLDLFRRQGRIKVADHELTATEFAIADRERLLAASVRLQYGLAAAAARAVQVADDLASTSRRLLDLVRARIDMGATPPLEGDLLEVEWRRLGAERLLAAGRADAALVTLKQLLGMAPDQLLLLQQTIEGLVAEPAIDTAIVTSTSPVRADVREAEARVTVAEARADQARFEARPEVSIFGSYMRMDAGFSQQGVNLAGSLERVRGRFNYVAAGATVTVPLFNRNQGQIVAAQAERSGASARRDAVALAVRAEIAVAQALDLQARRSVSLYADGVIILARRNLDVVRQTFDLGRATVFDVLAEQRRYLEIEQAYTNALREAWEARTALVRALG
ncbi:MAG: TolC family protein, partial [Acidobacteria bacterium]|nr:TolC family protein [Acidobacteriota bacterium]